MPKRILTIAAAIILGLPAVSVTTGQPAQQPTPPQLPERLEQEKILENRYKPMSGIQLTEEQQKRLFAMGHELRLKMDEIHADKSMNEPQKTALLQPIIWEAKQKLADILAEINPVAPKPQAKLPAAPHNQNPGNPQWETVTTSDGKRIQVNMAELVRPEIVNIGALEIPEAYKRKKIIDAKGRAITGQWLVIDRRIQSVKFRREDGKEFDIPFANLCEPDRRYAELETGITPNIGDPIDANQPNTASNWPFHFGSRPSRNWKTNAKDPKPGMK